MSSSIDIPQRSRAELSSGYLDHNRSAESYAGGSSAGSSVPTSDSSYQTPRNKGKEVVRHSEETPMSKQSYTGHERRTSLLSSSLSKCEHTVVNVGSPDGPPRLITCVKASQGFDWNQEIFLPSYASEGDFDSNLERRQDPVEDIFITEEEVERTFPR